MKNNNETETTIKETVRSEVVLKFYNCKTNEYMRFKTIKNAYQWLLLNRCKCGEGCDVKDEADDVMKCINCYDLNHIDEKSDAEMVDTIIDNDIRIELGIKDIIDNKEIALCKIIEHRNITPDKTDDNITDDNNVKLCRHRNVKGPFDIELLLVSQDDGTEICKSCGEIITINGYNMEDFNENMSKEDINNIINIIKIASFNISDDEIMDLYSCDINKLKVEYFRAGAILNPKF